MTVEELNEAAAEGTIDEVIRVAEARQVKALSRIADTICASPDTRLVLVSGGSAAGKTTTAKRICTQLRVNDRAAMHLSTDDYFVGDARNPRDEDGNLDYEHVDCVDIEPLANDLNALFRGETILRRSFDFVNHKPAYSGEFISLPKNGIIVLEGIHALNPRLSEHVDEAAGFRVFVDPQPSLDLFAGLKPSAADSRFLRRLVRDNQFRKLSPAVTLELWPKVLAGESKWIEPFRGNADATFDSYLVYELAVLKPYVGGLLARARLEVGETRQVMNMIRLISAVDAVSPNTVPGDSILRETIGGSQLEY
ncbi:MAG: nucleoside kinase [Kiritimatiellae bacterium]|nr:nucleoside kinase [Kiritimatiellia bacterium]